MPKSSGNESLEAKHPKSILYKVRRWIYHLGRAQVCLIVLYYYFAKALLVLFPVWQLRVGSIQLKSLCILRDLDLLLCGSWLESSLETNHGWFSQRSNAAEFYVSRTIGKRRWGFLSSRYLCRWRSEGPQWVKEKPHRMPSIQGS